MDATIHCPHCQHDLTVPAFATGHRARCPACREVFIVPPIDDSVDDTVCAWIEEDVEELIEHRHADVEQSLRAAAQAAAAPAHAEHESASTAGNGNGRPRIKATGARHEHRRPTWPTQLSRPEDRRRAMHRTGAGEEVDSSHPHGSRWEKLSPKLRQRLEVWVKFREGERFRHFYPDADFGPERLGLAGLVLTDQRLIYRHANHFGAAERWDADTSILINTRGESAVLTLAHQSNRDRMARVTHSDAEELAAALGRGGGFTVKHVDE